VVSVNDSVVETTTVTTFADGVTVVEAVVVALAFVTVRV
jgi:hypothetical protein